VGSSVGKCPRRCTRYDLDRIDSSSRLKSKLSYLYIHLYSPENGSIEERNTKIQKIHSNLKRKQKQTIMHYRLFS